MPRTSLPPVNPRPYRPVSPGEVLDRELKARRMSRKRLADRMGASVELVEDILRARRAITADIALSLAEALGTAAEPWMNMESNYRLDLARRARKAG